MQPAQAKEEKQRADDELEGQLGDMLDDELPEEHNQDGKGHKCTDGAVQRRAPPSRETHREHDRQRLSRLDRGAEKRGSEREELLVHINKMAW